MPLRAASLKKVGIVRPAKLCEQIESQIRDAILKQVYGAGEFLPSENELTSIFNVSRSVVREALKMLSTKGYIEIIQGKGAVVQAPSLDNVLDPFSQLVDYKCGKSGLVHILSVRQMVEPQVAGLSAQYRSDEDVTKLQETLHMMRDGTSDQVRISHYDIVFHSIIARSCNNPLIPIVLEPIFHVLAKFHPPIFFDQTIVDITLEYHGRIFKAIQEQNAPAAISAMAEHLKITETHNLRLYDKKKWTSGAQSTGADLDTV